MRSNRKILEILSRPIVYRSPKRLLAPPSWTMHAPFAMWLMDVAKPNTLVELGTFSGTSYCAFCQAVKELDLNTRCFAVDSWLGDSHSFFYGEEIFSDLRNYHDPLYSHFSELIRKDFDSALHGFENRSIDLLHIDGFHTYEAVKHDFDMWLPKVSERGVVLFHDTQVRERDFGVWRFWEEVRQLYPHAELLHGHGLGILLVGSNVPAELREVIELVSESTENMELFQGFFERLGSACLLEVKLKTFAEEIAGKEAQIQELTSTLNAHRCEIVESARAWELRGAEVERLSNIELSLRAELDKCRDFERELRSDLRGAIDRAIESDAKIAELEKSLSAVREMLEENAAAGREIKSRGKSRGSATESASGLEDGCSERIKHGSSGSLRDSARGVIIDFKGLASRASNLAPARKFARIILKLAAAAGSICGYSKGKSERNATRELILKSGLFDHSFYLKHNQDLIPKGVDPLEHYILQGGHLGLRCSPLFDAGFYLGRYPDIKAAGIHPLVHYIKHGQGEGRHTSQHIVPDLFLGQSGLAPATDFAIPNLPREKVSVATLFMVYGKSHVNFISNVLVPSLESLKGARPVELHLVNYAGAAALISSGRISDNLVVRDWSSERSDTHIGFGEGHNFLFDKVQPRDCFVIVNPDSCPYPGCLDRLFSTFEQTSAGIVEARQWPRAHPKEFSPQTFDTPWASGAFSLIDSETFKTIKGFDPIYFLYGEDVDLSWRVWLAGKRVVHEPKAICSHFTGLYSYQADRFYHEHFYSSRNFIVLAKKFFGQEGERYAIRELRACGYPNDFKDAILADYDKVKSHIQVINRPYHSMIKILGMNIFHLMRPDQDVISVEVRESAESMEVVEHVG